MGHAHHFTADGWCALRRHASFFPACHRRRLFEAQECKSHRSPSNCTVPLEPTLSSNVVEGKKPLHISACCLLQHFRQKRWTPRSELPIWVLCRLASTSLSLPQCGSCSTAMSAVCAWISRRIAPVQLQSPSGAGIRGACLAVQDTEGSEKGPHWSSPWTMQLLLLGRLC